MLITEEYRKLNSELHETNKYYGTSAINHAEEISSYFDNIQATSILDYGCGKGILKNMFGEKVIVGEYDPAISSKSGEPEPADLLVCIDVMEHIEPECIDNVIAHMASKVLISSFITIALTPAKKTLSDGRNAHISLHSVGWWIEAFAKHFKTLAVTQRGKYFVLFATGKLEQKAPE